MMPAVAPVHAHSVQASAPLRAKGAAKGDEGSASGSATAPAATSGEDFGKYFREQAGTAAGPAPKGPPEPAAAVASDVPAPGLEDAAPSLPESGSAVSAPAAALPDTPRSVILDQLQNRLHGTVVEVAAADGPKSGEADTLAAAPDKASDLDEAKIAKTSSSSTKGARQKEKTETAVQPKAAASTLPVSSGAPAATLAVTSAAPVIPLIPLKPVVFEKAQPAGTNSRHATGPTPTGGKAAPASSPAPAIMSAVASAQESQVGVPSQPPVTGLLPVAPTSQGTAGDEKDASVTGNSDASSRNSSPAAPSSRAVHTTTMPSIPAPAALSVAPSAAPHSEAPSSGFPHVTLGPPSPAPSAPAGSSPMGATALYDRMDQAPAPVVLHSGAQHMSVGVHDPNLGWVEIQTQNSGGHVDAMLVASSGQTHDSLAAQLPALAQFLEQRDVRVGTLAVQHPTQTAAGSGHGGGASSGGGMGSGTGYAGNGGAGARHSGSANAGSGRGAPQQPGGVRTARPGGVSGPATGTGSGGEASQYRPLSYISVRA